MEFEADINNYKFFYKENLSSLQSLMNREMYLKEIYRLRCEYNNKRIVEDDRFRFKIINDTKKFLKENFNSRVFAIFNKEIDEKLLTKASSTVTNKNLLITVVEQLANLNVTISERKEKELQFKSSFLKFLYDCISCYGLHPKVFERNPEEYKRYNIIVIYNRGSSKNSKKEFRILLSENVILEEYMIPYKSKIPLAINGLIIQFEEIKQIKISSTLLLDDEIELFAAKHSILWNDKGFRDTISFINKCQDETNTLYTNPYLSELNNNNFRNGKLYVDKTRIQQLKDIKSLNFDLSKLIQLCIELNNQSNENFFSITFLLRAIIDHVPPVFNYNNFSEFSSNYVSGTKSFQKAMKQLNNSLRNVADNNIHSQIRKKEILPTVAQIDFTQDLDLLLSEIIRVLK